MNHGRPLIDEEVDYYLIVVNSFVMVLCNDEILEKSIVIKFEILWVVVQDLHLIIPQLIWILEENR